MKFSGATPGDSQALADASPEDAGQAAEQPSTGADAPRNSGAGRGPPVRTDFGPENGLPGGVGDGDARMDLPTERGPPAATIVRGLETEKEETPARDFRITADHDIGEGSLDRKSVVWGK